MFHKVLAAMDSSAIGKLVFDEALALARAVQADLMLLHVLSVEEEVSPDMPMYPMMGYYPVRNDIVYEHYQKQWEAYERAGFDLLRSRTDEAIAAGVNTEFTQVSGDPGRAICHLAQNWEADLVVVGRRGRSGLSELILGSVSNYVLHHAPCSVMAVQTKTRVEAQPKVELSESGWQ
ncbi:universal stress protein [Oculatella sp. LEGE 06141]|uniref:universal stress protein n=1 Tax=Oculatella sp. LEGE 06141 TaxID=1828648 RepID=UPI0018818818|nr:universal stress protein [Oculatella sp. LEGE 06141]MBE9177271.1 universal stress protein [Oculatella sp. LEGE 06141]